MEKAEDKRKKWVEVDDIDACKCKVLAATCKVLSTEMQVNLIMSQFVSLITDLIEGELSDEKVSYKMYDICNTIRSFINIHRNDLKSQLLNLKMSLETEITSKYGCDCILFNNKDGVQAVISAEGEVTAMK